MTVTQHTVGDLFLLLTASLLCGILLSCVYVAFMSARAVAKTFVSPSFPKYSVFKDRLSAAPSPRMLQAVSDAAICIFIAVCVLTVSFLFNNGCFRPSAVALLLLGYSIGRGALSGIVRGMIVCFLFIVKWTVDLVSFPLVFLCRRLIRFISAFFKCLAKNRINKLIGKHTEYRLARIKNDTEYGLIEKIYKELKK